MRKPFERTFARAWPGARIWRNRWLPVPALAVAVFVSLWLERPGSWDSQALVAFLSLVFSTLASLFVAEVARRAFAQHALPSLLLLGCGSVIWAAGGLAVSALRLREVNAFITFHNLCALLSGACHLSGAVLSMRARRTLQPAPAWLTGGYLGAACLCFFANVAIHRGWMPLFFVQGQGGTPVRQVVLGAAVATYLAAALLLLAVNAGASAFGRWYTPALALVGIGLLGVLLQSESGSWVSWLGRIGQYLGGVYMTLAAVAAAREARAWGASVELDLRDTRLRYEALFTASPEAILVSDADGRIVAANPAAEVLFGRSEPALRRAGRVAVLGGAAPPAGAGATAGGRTELELRRADGAPFVGELSSIAVGPAGPRFDLVRDVTERRRSEEALREADRRKDHFLAVLSHELRNPLTPIRNSVHLLRHAPAGSDVARRALDVLDRQARQLTHLVDDLLDVTRIARDRIQLRRARLDFAELVRRAAEDHRADAEARGVRLALEVGTGPLLVDGDETRLSQVVGNLLVNAAKFGRPGGTAKVTVERDPANGRALLRVRDDGVGMSPEVLGRLFEPFAQADETLDRSQGGLGLGLALVKGLVELHGGTVEARSAGPGQGSEFEVALPLAPAAAWADGARASPAPRPRRILIIEDNSDAADSLRQVLELHGHEVVGAVESGPAGLSRARASRPEIVLCDIGLPEMDGFDVARAFRGDPALRTTHLVALTGYAQPDDVRRAREAGFEAHLAKPPDLGELEALLARLPA